MSDKTQIRAVRAPWYSGVELLARQGNEFGVLMFERKPEGLQIEPTMRIGVDEAQALMDDLWNCGLRPTEGAGSAGAMRAVERHVDDLRSIVFKVLDVPSKETR